MEIQLFVAPLIPENFCHSFNETALEKLNSKMMGFIVGPRALTDIKVY